MQKSWDWFLAFALTLASHPPTALSVFPQTWELLSSPQAHLLLPGSLNSQSRDSLKALISCFLMPAAASIGISCQSLLAYLPAQGRFSLQLRFSAFSAWWEPCQYTWKSSPTQSQPVCAQASAWASGDKISWTHHIPLLTVLNRGRWGQEIWNNSAEWVKERAGRAVEGSGQGRGREDMRHPWVLTAVWEITWLHVPPPHMNELNVS